MTEDCIIEQALGILESRLKSSELTVSSAQDVKNYLQLKLADLEHESFNVMFLDTKHGLIEMCALFRGTIDSAAVYPREVVKATLAFNAAAVILSHNHPSGDCTPSFADRQITQKLQDALSLIDVKVLDHIVVGRRNSYSFAEHGLM